MSSNIANRLALLAALALVGCASAPDIDPIAQQTTIGLSQRDILACMGAPASRRWVAEGMEIWTYPSGETTTDTPPWAWGLNFSAIGPPQPCDVRIVMTKAHVSQVAYSMPDGRMLPSGRQCTFAVYACARRRELL
jgi:hypothetical protein